MRTVIKAQNRYQYRALVQAFLSLIEEVREEERKRIEKVINDIRKEGCGDLAGKYLRRVAAAIREGEV